MNKAKYIVIGIIIGALIGMPLAWAASRITLQNGSGEEVGTAANPLIVQGV